MKSLYAYIKSSTTEEAVAKQISTAINRYQGLSCKKEYEYPLSGLRADFMLMKYDKPFAAIEVKTDVEDLGIREVGEGQLERGRILLNLRFGILTDSEEYLLYDWWQTKQPSKFSDLNALLLELHKRHHVDIDASQYKKLLKNVVCSAFTGMSISEDKIEYSQADNTIRLHEEEEIKLFDMLFPKVAARYICRYTTLQSLFAVLENESYRMCATEGMNDVEDGMFLWNKLYDEKQKESYLEPYRNPTYILSCSPIKKQDDLTMWRLYGDDARGVCLTFKTGKSAHNNGFYLRKVRYDNEIIQQLRSLTEYNKGKFSSYPTFIFNYWELWGAFVKSPEYKIEEEIRFAYIQRDGARTPDNDDKRWLLTIPNSIVCQYVDFKEKIDPFPLKLTHVHLGPECLEKRTNKVQLMRMIQTTKTFKSYKVVVEESKLTSYRSSKKI